MLQMQSKVQLNAMQSAKRCIAVDGSLLTYGARGIPNWSHCTRHRTRLYCIAIHFITLHSIALLGNMWSLVTICYRALWLSEFKRAHILSTQDGTGQNHKCHTLRHRDVTNSR